MATQLGAEYAGAVGNGPLPNRETRDSAMQPSAGSMGSRVYRWRFRPEQLPAVMAHDWDRVGRRVRIDPEEAVVTLMALSAPHERLP